MTCVYLVCVGFYVVCIGFSSLGSRSHKVKFQVISLCVHGRATGGKILPFFLYQCLFSNQTHLPNTNHNHPGTDEGSSRPRHGPLVVLTQAYWTGLFLYLCPGYFFFSNLFMKSLVSIKLQKQKQTNKTKQLCLNNLLQLREYKKTF